MADVTVGLQRPRLRRSILHGRWRAALRSIIIRRKMRAGSGKKMSTRAVVSDPQPWVGSHLPVPLVTSRSHHADPRQSSRDHRVFRTFLTLVLLGGQRCRRSAAETSCWGSEGGGRELFAVALSERTRCCCKVFQETSQRGRLGHGAPETTQGGESVEPRGRRQRVSWCYLSPVGTFADSVKPLPTAPANICIHAQKHIPGVCALSTRH